MKSPSTQSFKNSYPLSFELTDAHGSNAIYIVPDDLIEKQELHLTIQNISTEQLYLEHISVKPDAVPTEKDCHFELRFRPGTLSKGSLGQHTHPAITGPRLKITTSKKKQGVNGGSWRLSTPQVNEDETVSIYIARFGDSEDWPLDQQASIPLVLTQISAVEGEEGTRNTRVLLIPKRIHKKVLTGDPTAPHQNIPLTEIRERVIKVVNHIGVPFMPVHFGFRGPNTILNDGKANRSMVYSDSPNSLRFRLENTSAKQTIRFKKNSRIQLHFADEFAPDYDPPLSNHNGNNLASINFKIREKPNPDATYVSKFHIIRLSSAGASGKELFWELDFDLLGKAKFTELGPKEYIDFYMDISAYATTHYLGLEYLYLSYENITGYWDSRLLTHLAFTPLKITKELIDDTHWVVANPGGRPLLVTAPNTENPVGHPDATTRLHINSNVKIEKGNLTLTEGFLELTQGNVQTEKGNIRTNEGAITGRKTQGTAGWFITEGDWTNNTKPALYVSNNSGPNAIRVQKGDVKVLNGMLSVSKPGYTAIQVEDGDIRVKNGALHVSKINALDDYINLDGKLVVAGERATETTINLVKGGIALKEGDLEIEKGSMVVSSRKKNVFAGVFENNSSGIDKATLILKNDGERGYALVAAGRAIRMDGQPIWEVPSDRRLKEDIEPYREGLSTIQQIRPVWYRYKDSKVTNSPNRNVGIIAQELQEIAPHMVSEFKGESGQTYLSTDTSAMSFMLVNAVKELSAELDAVKAELKALREEMRELRNA